MKKIPRREFLTTSSLALSASLLPTVPNANENSQQVSEVKIRRLSWAGIQIEFEGTTLFIDPWVSHEIWGETWTEPIVPLETKNTSKHVAITHVHNDHWDPKAIKAIYGERKGVILCGPQSALSIAAHQLPEVRPRELWEPHLVNAGKIVVIAVPAHDFSGIEQVSWVIKVGGKTLFHGGDTIWHGFFHRISHAYGPFDAVFLPINGVDHLGLKPNSHIPATLTPVQAAAAGVVLQSKLVIPIHYGFTDPASYIEFPEAEKTFIKECKNRAVPVEICASGDWVTWKANR